jgi:phosphoserine phosphatase
MRHVKVSMMPEDAMSKSTALVATCVAGSGARLSPQTLAQALRTSGLAGARIEWLAAESAADVFVDGAWPSTALSDALRAALAPAPVDVIVQPVRGRRKAVLVADMDSTIIREECIDELADCKGLRAHIAAITRRAMDGELDFAAALRERVALLKGVTRSEVFALRNRLTLTPGARALVATMRAHGAYAALVSGGFAPFTEAIAQRLGFDENRANDIEFVDDALSGRVREPVQGAEAKRLALWEICARQGLSLRDALAVGDGANDLDMIAAAGLGVAFRARPGVAAHAAARIDYADLTALLYAQGYSRSSFREAG